MTAVVFVSVRTHALVLHGTLKHGGTVIPSGLHVYVLSGCRTSSSICGTSMGKKRVQSARRKKKPSNRDSMESSEPNNFVLDAGQGCHICHYDAPWILGVSKTMCSIIKYVT